RDQKEIPNSGKLRNKSIVIDKSLQRVVLDIFNGIAPVDWIEKLKAKINTNMPAHAKSLSTSTPPIQKSDFRTGKIAI
ncbi:7059_t:CDS:2, partial [Gigaspora margarita]